MPMIPMPIDDSMVSLSSVVTASIVFIFAVVHGMKPSVWAGIAVAVGLVLYFLKVVPIGLLVTVCIALIVGIFKAMVAK